MKYSYPINNCIQLTQFHSMFECTRQPGYAFTGETHDFWECVYVQSGRICVTGDDRVYKMEKGEIIFHKPMELHKYHVDGTQAAKLFIFSYSSYGELNEFFKNKVFELNIDQLQIIENLLAYIHSLDINVPENYTQELLQTLVHMPLQMQTIATFLYSMLLSIYSSNQISLELNIESARLFKQAVNYMKNNISTSLTITDIAEHCCISATGLKTLFASYTGLGVHKYFLKLKINLATKLLEQGTSVNVVADTLGFSGQAYFSAAYKRETGRSPSDISKYSKIQ